MTSVREAKAVTFSPAEDRGLNSCDLCGAVVHTAREALHREWHVNVAEFLRSLRDGKQDVGGLW